MQGVTLGWVARACGGKLMSASRNQRVTGLCIDSRRVQRGDVFVALPGKHADGHEFISAAIRKGAAAVLCRKAPAGVPAIRVSDPRRALGKIGGAYRQRFKKLLVAAITGSSGKTSTKEMLAQVLAVRFRVLQTLGNLNNDLGLPLTLSRLEKKHTAAALELGMSAAGEIRYLAGLAKPKIGVITNIGEAHIGHFHDRQDLARAKAELLRGLAPGGTAVLNADDPYLARLRFSRRLLFGQAPTADVRILKVSVRLLGTQVLLGYKGQTAAIRLRSLGAHHAWNAAAAVAAGIAAGVPFATASRALSGHGPQAKMRGQLLRLGPHRLLNDVYNSNPQSAAAALALLAELPCKGQRIFVAGSMLELGPLSAEAHQRIGHTAALSGVTGLLAVGQDARELARAAEAAGVRRVEQVAVAAGVGQKLLRWLSPEGDLILVKGSRGIGLEAVVKELQAAFHRPSAKHAKKSSKPTSRRGAVRRSRAKS